MKPGRCDRRQTFRGCKHILNIPVGSRILYIVPGHINLVIFRYTCVLWFFKAAGNRLLFDMFQRIRLYISDKSIAGANFLPAILILDHSHFLWFFYLCQDRTLYSTLKPHLCIPLHLCHSRLSELIHDHHTIRILIFFAFHIRVLFHKVQSNICLIIDCLPDDILFTFLFADFCIFLTSYVCNNTSLRQCIQQ